MAKTRTKEQWEYQWVNSRGKTRWIPEDDWSSAQHKARNSDGATGKIRGRLVTVKTTKWKEETVD